jgi:hypothetical protein
MQTPRPRRVNHLERRTRSKARYSFLLGLRDIYDDLTFTAIEVRSANGAVSAPFFGQPVVAACKTFYAAMLWCASTDAAESLSGNDSANLDVEFAPGTDWADVRMNVHASEMIVWGAKHEQHRPSGWHSIA